MRFSNPISKRAATMTVDQAKQALELPQWPVSEAVLSKQYRTMALKHHPDRGGSDEKMKDINAAAEILFKELEKSGESKPNTWSELHSAVDQALKDYKHISHEDVEKTAELLAKEELLKKIRESGEFELAKNNKIKIKLKSGGEIVVAVSSEKRRDKSTNYRPKTFAVAEIVGFEGNVAEETKQKFPIGKLLSDAEATRLYDRAERYRNLPNYILKEKKSLARQSEYEKTFDADSADLDPGSGALGSMAYYNTDPSEQIAKTIIAFLLKTNVLKKLTRGARAGKVEMNPHAITDLGKAKALNARFIAGIAAQMRGFVDKRVVSNAMGSMDAGAWANDIADAIVFGEIGGMKKFEKEQGLDHIPYREEEISDYTSKTVDQTHQQAYQKEYDEIMAKEKKEIEDRIRQLERSPNTQFHYDKQTSIPRHQRIENERRMMEERAEKYAKESASRHAGWAKERHEKGLPHATEGLYKYDKSGQHSEPFKKKFAEYLEKAKKKNELQSVFISRMNAYAKVIAKVLLEMNLMEPHQDADYRFRSQYYGSLSKRLNRIGQRIETC